MSARDRLHPTAVRDNDRAIKELIARVHDRTPRPPRGGRRFAPQGEPPPWVVAPRRPQVVVPASEPVEPDPLPVDVDADLMAAQLVEEIEEALRRRGVEERLVADVMLRLRAQDEVVDAAVPLWRRGVAVTVIAGIVWQALGGSL